MYAKFDQKHAVKSLLLEYSNFPVCPLWPGSFIENQWGRVRHCVEFDENVHQA